MTNSSQTVTGGINFDSFGNTAGTSGSSANPYMYAGDWGYRNDGDAGLTHVGARYYDAQAGRFITRDTFLDQHPYLYCEHDPVNGVDPSGHQIVSALGKAVQQAGDFSTGLSTIGYGIDVIGDLIGSDFIKQSGELLGHIGAIIGGINIIVAGGSIWIGYGLIIIGTIGLIVWIDRNHLGCGGIAPNYPLYPSYGPRVPPHYRAPDYWAW